MMILIAFFYFKWVSVIIVISHTFVFLNCNSKKKKGGKNIRGMDGVVVVSHFSDQSASVSPFFSFI